MSRIFTFLFSILSLFCLFSSGIQAENAVPLVFNSKQELPFIHPERASTQWSSTPVAIPEWNSEALGVTLQSGVDYPGFEIKTGGNFPDNLSRYTHLAVEFYNPLSYSIPLYLRIDDRQTRGYSTRYNGPGWGMRPGKSTFKIPLQSLKIQDQSRLLELKNIEKIIFFTIRLDEPVQFFLNNLQLETLEEKALTEDNRCFFDFGGKNTPVFPGFEQITPESRFEEHGEFGFLTPVSLYSRDLEAPDPLSRDAVTGNLWQPYEYGFAVKVPSGKYHTAVIARHISPAKLPTRHGIIAAEQKTLVEKPMSAEIFYSGQVLYRFLDRPYQLDQDAWEKFFSPDLEWQKSTIEVKDNRLNLIFSNMAVFALVIVPAEDEQFFEKTLAEIDSKRKEIFHEKHYFEEHHPPSDFQPSTEELQRKFAACVVSAHEAVFPWSRPGDFESAQKLSLEVAKGEKEPFSVLIYPLEDLSLEISSKPDPKNFPGPEHLEIRQVQYREEEKSKGVFVPREAWMTPVQGPVSFQKNLAQRLWFTLSIPKDQEPGIYSCTFEISSGTGAPWSQPVEIEVLGLPLPDKLDFAGGWYYSPPLELNYHYKAFGLIPPVWREMLEKELHDMKNHGCTTFQFPAPKISGTTSNGSLEFDFTVWDAVAETARKVGIGLEHPPQTFMINVANRIQKQEGSPAFASAYRRSVEKLFSWTRQQDFPLVFWVVDEPRQSLQNSWNRDRQHTEYLLEALQNISELKTTVTLMGDSHSGTSYLPLAKEVDIIQTHPWEKSERIIRDARQNNKSLWSYNAGSDRLSYGFHPWAMGAKGRYQWHYAFWSDPSNPFVMGWGVTFPSPDGPLPTPAYEMTREGLEDLRWLQALERKISKSPDSAVCRAARGFLDEIQDEIPVYLEHGLDTGEEAGQGYEGQLNRKMPQWRNKIRRWLIRFISLDG